jgi:hypothetical protein
MVATAIETCWYISLSNYINRIILFTQVYEICEVHKYISFCLGTKFWAFWIHLKRRISSYILGISTALLFLMRLSQLGNFLCHYHHCYWHILAISSSCLNYSLRVLGTQNNDGDNCCESERKNSFLTNYVRMKYVVINYCHCYKYSINYTIIILQ